MCRTFPFLVLFLALTLTSSAQEEPPERDLREELFLAIEMNDPAEVRRALVDGAASEADFGDPSPLGTAAALNNETIVEMLRSVTLRAQRSRHARSFRCPSVTTTFESCTGSFCASRTAETRSSGVSEALRRRNSSRIGARAVANSSGVYTWVGETPTW